MLRTLFLETQIVLGGGHSKTERTERIERAKAELRAQLPEWSDDDFAAYAGRHSQAYWLRVDLPQRSAMRSLSRRNKMLEPIIDFQTDASAA